MPERRVKGKADFALVELLVVITIISILASLLLPALKSARDMAHQIQCGSNQKQIGIGTESYCSDNKGFFPYPNNTAKEKRNAIYYKQTCIANSVRGSGGQ